MTNMEVFKDAIWQVACLGDIIAFDKEKYEVAGCSNLDCSKCLFNDSYDRRCNVKITEWLRDEFDWTQIPVDTPVLVKDCETDSWIRRYFAGYDKDRDVVLVWMSGMTSWTANRQSLQTYGYKYAKSDISALDIDKNVGANIHE